MKYIIVLGDGMSDEPVPQLGDKTPLEAANTPWMDALAGKSEMGLAQTIPQGMNPGSDTANLSVLGYDPRQYYSGRSPLEALSIGVEMGDADIALRCNLVTLASGSGVEGKSESRGKEYGDMCMVDHGAGEITTQEAAELLEAVKEVLQNDVYRFYVGTSYRHLTIWRGGSTVPLTPPHDILGRRIGEYLPGDGALRSMMEQSFPILDAHPINRAREAKGLHKANSIWFWGAGTKPALDSFEDKYGKKGAMISAVDLLKGIAVGSGMGVVHVEGADGTLDTNWEGKADACVEALTHGGYDFVYVHVEAPDEMGHQGDADKKVQAIEYLDERVIGRICERMKEAGEPYRMLVMPDHPTPLSRRTHTSDPVPYLLYDSTTSQDGWEGGARRYNEREAGRSGNPPVEGHRLIERLLARRQSEGCEGGGL